MEGSQVNNVNTPGTRDFIDNGGCSFFVFRLSICSCFVRVGTVGVLKKWASTPIHGRSRGVCMCATCAIESEVVKILASSFLDIGPSPLFLDHLLF